MTSPIPLRERLACALANPGRCEHAGCESCDPWWRADAALPAIRDWLRQEAAALRAHEFPPVPGPAGEAFKLGVEYTAKYLDEVLAFAIDRELER